jgi:Na+/proline symporter
VELGYIDIVIIFAYIIALYAIARKAKLFIQKKAIAEGQTNFIQNHYIAGKSITFWELLLSIIATEFSALAFLMIPTYVYYENLSFIRFIFGACISRIFIATFFIPIVYGKGLTIFETLARGIYGYSSLRQEANLGRKTFAFFYISGKLVGVSVKLLGSALLISEFFSISPFLAIIMIALMTYFYIILGGLKAVVRTDMLQAAVFITGGVAAHFIIGKMSSFTWGELISFGFQNGKFSLLSDSGILSFVYGIIGGFIYDANSHGVDQEMTQKLFGAVDVDTAKKAMLWSALGSILINLLFLSLGVILWAYYTKHGQSLPPPEKIFSNLIELYFPSPIKGLMVASVLAAAMSTLDSSINALSAVLWNDLMTVKDSKEFKLFINLDNLIITLGIVIFSFILHFVPEVIKIAQHFSYIATGSLLAFFLCRMIFSRYIRIRFNTSLILLSFYTCLLGMALNHFHFGFNPQLTILWGVTSTILFFWGYSLIGKYFKSSSESEYSI